MGKNECQGLDNAKVITSWMDTGGADFRFMEVLMERGARLITPDEARNLPSKNVQSRSREKVLVILGEHQKEHGRKGIQDVMEHIKRKKVAHCIVSFQKESAIEGAQFIDPYKVSPDNFAGHIALTLDLLDFPMPAILKGYPVVPQRNISVGSKHDKNEYAHLWIREKDGDWTVDLWCDKKGRLFQQIGSWKRSYMQEIKNENDFVNVGNCDATKDYIGATKKLCFFKSPE